MKVHEYQAKEILQKCGIAIPEQIVARTEHAPKFVLAFSEWMCCKSTGPFRRAGESRRRDDLQQPGGS